jgi:hypothetical protein
VDGIAAKIAQKIVMLFQNGNVDANARQQHTQHQPGRAASRDCTLYAPFHGRSVVERVI